MINQDLARDSFLKVLGQLVIEHHDELAKILLRIWTLTDKKGFYSEKKNSNKLYEILKKNKLVNDEADFKQKINILVIHSNQALKIRIKKHFLRRSIVVYILKSNINWTNKKQKKLIAGKMSKESTGHILNDINFKLQGINL